MRRKRMNEIWILLTAVLTTTACALVGSFLVLKKMALMGDAISHAVLPGLAIAFLITGTRNPLWMLVGAGIFGLITVVSTDMLHKFGKMKEDASLGSVFTSLFAVGVILISLYSDQVDLDQECVLYGEIAFVPWDRFWWGDIDLGPRAVWITGGVTLLNIILVTAAFKELKIYAFDPALAVALGLPITLIHFSLMVMVSLTTVATFESVGAILVVAMIIVPPATAYLIFEDLKEMIMGSIIFGASSAFLGYFLAGITNSSIAASMAVSSGVIFAMVLGWHIMHNRSASRKSDFV